MSDSTLQTKLSTTKDRPICSVCTPPPIVADNKVLSTSSGVPCMDGEISY